MVVSLAFVFRIRLFILIVFRALFLTLKKISIIAYFHLFHVFKHENRVRDKWPFTVSKAKLQPNNLLFVRQRIPNSDTASVGLGGLATGGGIGFLVRKYGLTVDNLMAAIVVTADGQIRHVNAETHPDLFWAIRGGGGNFGVVTHFKFRLHEVSTIVGGMLILPATAKVMAAFAAAAEAAPEELSTIVYNMPAPPMPFLPEEYHGQVVTLAMLVYTGDVEEGLRAVAPFRELAEPIVDMLGPMPYSEIYWPDDPNYHPVTALRSKFIDHIDERTAQIMLDHLHTSPADVRIAEFRVLGGAMARVPVEATAFAHRS